MTYYGILWLKHVEAEWDILQWNMHRLFIEYS